MSPRAAAGAVVTVPPPGSLDQCNVQHSAGPADADGWTAVQRRRTARRRPSQCVAEQPVACSAASPAPEDGAGRGPCEQGAREDSGQKEGETAVAEPSGGSEDGELEQQETTITDPSGIADIVMAGTVDKGNIEAVVQRQLSCEEKTLEAQAGKENQHPGSAGSPATACTKVKRSKRAPKAQKSMPEEIQPLVMDRAALEEDGLGAGAPALAREAKPATARLRSASLGESASPALTAMFFAAMALTGEGLAEVAPAATPTAQRRAISQRLRQRQHQRDVQCGRAQGAACRRSAAQRPVQSFPRRGGR